MAAEVKFINNELLQLPIEQVLELGEKSVSNGKLTFDLSKTEKEMLEQRVKDAKTPQIKFTQTAYDKMFALVDEHYQEIAWHGIVERTEKEKSIEYLITDIIMYPQKTAASTVDAIESEITNWNMSLDDDTVNNMRMQGHSHVNMQAFSSGTDEATMQGIMSQVTDYYIFFIVNKRRDAYIRFYDIESNLVYEKLSYTIKGRPNQTEWAKENIEKYIKAYEKKTTTSYPYTGKVKDYSKEKENTITNDEWYQAFYNEKTRTYEFPDEMSFDEYGNPIPETFEHSQDIEDYYEDIEGIRWDTAKKEPAWDANLALSDSQNLDKFPMIAKVSVEKPIGKRSDWVLYEIINGDSKYKYISCNPQYAADLIAEFVEVKRSQYYQVTTLTKNYDKIDYDTKTKIFSHGWKAIPLKETIRFEKIKIDKEVRVN